METVPYVPHASNQYATEYDKPYLSRVHGGWMDGRTDGQNAVQEGNIVASFRIEYYGIFVKY